MLLPRRYPCGGDGGPPSEQNGTAERRSSQIQQLGVRQKSSKTLEQIDGNQTLVISLEGSRCLHDMEANSDIFRLFQSH